MEIESPATTPSSRSGAGGPSLVSAPRRLSPPAARFTPTVAAELVPYSNPASATVASA